MALTVLIFTTSSLTLASASISSKKDEAKRIKSQIDSLKKGLSKTTQEYEDAYQKYSIITTEIQKTEENLRINQLKLEKNQRKLNKRLTDIYLNGSLNIFDVIFGSKDFTEFLNRLDYLKKIGAQDKDVLNKNKKLKKEFQENKAILAEQKSKQKKVVNQLYAKQNKIEESLAKEQKLLSGVKDEIKKLEEIEKRKRLFSYSLSSRSRGSYPKISGIISSILKSGFIFPVAGPNSYIDSYGASRPGHRHQGTDIMAARGTPVVAVVNGVFRAKKGSRNTYGGGWRGMLYASDGTYYYYAHLDDFAPSIQASSNSYSSGVSVKAGQVIGYVGNSGNAGPYHLHFEIHPGGGGSINPYPILRASQ